jgi:hypothetical protein
MIICSRINKPLTRRRNRCCVEGKTRRRKGMPMRRIIRRRIIEIDIVPLNFIFFITGGIDECIGLLLV